MDRINLRVYLYYPTAYFRNNWKDFSMERTATFASLKQLVETDQIHCLDNVQRFMAPNTVFEDSMTF